MNKHRIVLTDDQIRMIIIGLDVYSAKWSGYASRRERGAQAMRGVRINSVEEKQMEELMRSDVLAAESIVNSAKNLRDHLAVLLKPSPV